MPHWSRSPTGWLSAIPLAGLAVGAFMQRWVTDDAFIFFRVVSNIEDGNGPVWNVGERVETYTSPLWLGTLWLADSVLWFASVEWIAVVLGGAGTIAGAALAGHASLRLWRSLGRTGVGLPLGLLVLAALRPMWDFATSGLETGMTFLWLGGTFWLLVRLATAQRGRAALIAVLIGLGPLVRPDLAIFSVAFMVALLVALPTPGVARKVRLVALALALPVAYQVFRMGYFAALEPNTALTKEAGQSNWSRGWDYLLDFLDPYVLFVPIALIFVLAALDLSSDRAGPPRATLAAAIAPVAAAVVYAIYIVRVGGDFMHGRMLLPALFGLLLPVAVVAPGRRALGLAFAAATVVWAVVAAATLRAPYADGQSSGRFVDERAGYVAQAGTDNPVTLDDYSRSPWAIQGRSLRRLADGRALLLRIPLVYAGPLQVNGEPRASSPQPVVAGHKTIGLVGYAAGPRVHVVDQLGLADPIASRTKTGTIRYPPGTLAPARGDGSDQYLVLPPRYRAGHEKHMPTEWIAARFGPPDRDSYPGVAMSPSGVRAARRALGCRELEELLEAVTAPMDADRFLSNLGDSFSLTSLRFRPDPIAAERELCD